MTNETHGKVNQEAENLDTWELLAEGLVATMEKVRIPIEGNERFLEIHNELVDRINGKWICDGCREKARKSANEPQVAS